MNAALKPEDSAAAIETFLRSRGWPFTYARYLNRYQSVIRDPGGFFRGEIAIFAYLDSQKRFQRVEAIEVYTFL